MASWREVYLLKPRVMKLNIEVDNGRLVYRPQDQVKESAIKQLKKDWIQNPFPYLKNYQTGC